ncbi:MAG: ABC transporter ATP-binding protein [Nitrososphaeria archaeon]
MGTIIVEGLTKYFGSIKAVDHLTFEVGEGEIFGILGPNGAGKTTTIRMLACLIKPSEGSATVGGYDILKDAIKVRELVGILTENPSLYERLTALENMDFFAEAYGVSDKKERYRRIKDWLEFFGLWDRRNDKVVTFSKGMKQKLAIARALVHRPPILFLDEPTSGLDPESSKEIRDLMERLSRREKHTILLCTHRLEDAERLCNRVMIINQGRSIVIGSPEELRNKIGDSPKLVIKLREIHPIILEAVKVVSGVRMVKVNDLMSELEIEVNDIDSITPEIVKEIVYAGGQILKVNVLRPTLEEAYLRLIKEGLC